MGFGINDQATKPTIDNSFGLLTCISKTEIQKNMNIFQTYCNEKIIFLVAFLDS